MTGTEGAGRPTRSTPSFRLSPPDRPVTPSVFAQMRSQWRTLLLDKPTSPDDAYAVHAAWVARTARRAAETMERGPGKPFLWADSSLAEHASFAVSRSYQRLYAMALGLTTPGSDTYDDPALLADVVDGLDWMATHYYRPDGVIVGNWYEWQIAGPLALNDTAVLLFDELGQERISLYSRATANFVPEVTGTAANRALLASVVLGRGVLTDDAETVSAAIDGLDDVLRYTESGDGFHRDGSFVQHDCFAYTASYGNLLLGTLPRLLRTVKGTPWQVDPAIVFEWIRDAWDPFVWRGVLMDLVAGRTIARFDQQDAFHGREAHDAVDALLPCAPAGVAAWLEPLLRDWSGEGESGVRDPLATSRVFPAMARVVHRCRDWALGIAMFSPTVGTYESINEENLKGWATADGATYLYTGDPGHFSDAWWPTVDPYRIPGITIDPRKREDAEGTGYRNPHDWVGGATLDERYTAAGMGFEAEGSTLRGQKSWFCFDREVVALGTGITACDNRNVETIVENRRLTRGDEVVLVDGEATVQEPGAEITVRDARWIHLEGTGGYVLADPGTPVNLLRETRTGRWSDINRHPVWARSDLLERHYATFWFDHGTDPADARYAYTVLPGASEVETAMHARRPVVDVVANTTDVHAVRQVELGLLAVNAWTAGSASIAHCSSPMSVLVAERATELAIAVADPTGLQTTLRLRLNVAGRSVVAADPAVSVVDLDPLVIEVDVSGAKGATRSVTVAYTPIGPAALHNLLTDLSAQGELDDATTSGLSAELAAVSRSAASSGPARGRVRSFRAHLATRVEHGLTSYARDLLDDAAARLLAHVPA